jgi:GntR family frlABCD operon transcriptional regulator
MGLRFKMHRPKSAVVRTGRAGITRYLQLYHHLSRELSDGRFAPHEPLPSEPELVKLHGVSRTTVRRALQRLEREGRIERRRGSGTYARESRQEPSLLVKLQEFCDLRAHGASVRVLHAGAVDVPRSLQTRHPELGTRARAMTRMRSRRGAAFQLESIYLCGASGVSVTIERAVHEISAVTADAATSRLLGVVVGTPLLRLKTSFLGRKDKLLAVADCAVRCDRANVLAELKKDGPNGTWLLQRA